MKSRFAIILFASVLSFWPTTPLTAGDVNLPPTLRPNPSSIPPIQEQGLMRLGVIATDPEGDALTYTWTIPSDPTNEAFFRKGDGSAADTIFAANAVRFGVRQGPNFPNPSFSGMEVEVLVEVSDGVNTSSHTFTVLVSGVNLPPEILVDTDELGTIDSPRLEGGGWGVNAIRSRDPNGSAVKFLWKIGGLSGGQPCAGTGALVLHGNYSERPGLVVPKMTSRPSNPTAVFLDYYVEDGLYLLTGRFTGYMASPNGCSTATPGGGGGTNNPPVVSAAVSATNARFGQTVTLTGTASDPGDSLTYSWVYLSTTGGPQIAISGSTNRIATFVAPSVAGFYSFRFTATDSANQSRSTTVTVQVSQNGGGSGGGGGGPSQGGEEGPSGTGQLSCGGIASQGGSNDAAIASVPTTYTIVGGNRAEITARNGRDPDNTTTFLNGQNVSGVTYLWNVVDGGGFLSNSDLSGRMTSTVEFGTPESAQTRNATLSVAVNDAVGCGTVYTVSVAVQPAPVNNNAPDAVLQYLVEDTGEEGDATGNSVTVFPPAQIRLDASDSVDADGDSLTFNWTVQPNLAGVTLGQGSAVRILSVVEGVEGEVTVTVSVSDGKGGTVSRSVNFQFQTPDDKPVLAQAVALRDGEPIDGPVPPGVILSLSGADTDVEGGTAEERANLTYSWRQITPSPVAFARNMDQQEAEIVVEGVESVTSLTFRLTARNGGAVGTADVSFTVDPSLREETFEEGGELRFAQVGFGPLPDGVFQSVLVLDNVGADDVDDVRIEFFNSDGTPLQVDYVDTDGDQPQVRNWLPEVPLAIPANTSRVLEFRAPEGAGVEVGWASVTSSGRLRGSVRFQEIDQSGAFRSDVGISSSQRGSKFQAAFRSQDGIAFAVSNPESERINIRVTITDRHEGWSANRDFSLDPRHHTARFVQNFFNFLQNLPEEGTIELEVMGSGTMIPTLLITRMSRAVSSQSLARVQ